MSQFKMPDQHCHRFEDQGAAHSYLERVGFTYVERVGWTRHEDCGQVVALTLKRGTSTLPWIIVVFSKKAEVR